jgi:hypothetical protein
MSQCGQISTVVFPNMPNMVTSGEVAWRWLGMQPLARISAFVKRQIVQFTFYLPSSQH